MYILGGKMKNNFFLEKERVFFLFLFYAGEDRDLIFKT